MISDKRVPQLLVTNKQHIREIDFQGHSAVKVHNLTNAVGLDYDYDTGCLYWSDVSRSLKVIRRQCPGNDTFEVQCDVC